MAQITQHATDIDKVAKFVLFNYNLNMTLQKPTIKILYVITQGEWGGAQRYVYDLATNLKDDFEIFIAVGERNGRKDLQNKILNSKLETLNKSEIQIIQLRHLVRKISLIHDILAIFELAELCKALKPDIVHLNSSKAGITGSLARLFCTLAHLRTCTPKIIYTVHGWVFNEPNRKLGRWLYRFLEKFTARWKDKIIVLSKQDFLSGKRLGISEDKLIEIPLGIETPKFLSKEEARKALSRISNIKYLISNFWVGTIANLYKTKGIDILIEAANILNIKYQISNIKFVIVGEGPERENLENLIKKYHLENTVFLIGALENAAQYLPAFDLFVLPSRKEGLPYSILEVIAAHVPVVASMVGGISSLIEHNKTGLLAKPENADDLARLLTYALHYPEKMRKMADNTYGEAQKFTTSLMAERTTLLYFTFSSQGPQKSCP